MGQGLDFEAVDQHQEPDELNDDRFDQEGYFLVSGERSAELDHGVEFELVLIGIKPDGDHSEHHEKDGQAPEEILVLKEFEHQCPLSGWVCGMCIN